MFAECIGSRGYDVPEYLNISFVDPLVEFDLQLGKKYAILGMEIYKGLIQVLVADDSDLRRPQWLPVRLFKILDCKIPDNWYFRNYGVNSDGAASGFQGRWGYRLLVDSDEHRDGLEDLDPTALAIFGAELRAMES